LGITVGVACNPATHLGSLEYLRDGIDFVNVLTSEPDGHGEQMLPEMARRVAATRSMFGADIAIQVDGGVSTTNLAALRASGADDFVVGRALVDQDEFQAALLDLRGQTSRTAG
jgi:pentose-5-phosphate-3-epimerase